MRLDDAGVVHRHRQNGNRFWRGTYEVEINSSVLKILRRELFARGWMLVVTQFQERIARHNPTRFQTQLFRSDAQPVTTLRFILCVVIVMRQMLVKIRLRCLPIFLWDAAKHNSPV